MFSLKFLLPLKTVKLIENIFETYKDKYYCKMSALVQATSVV